jgi:hypothetical protein
MTRPVTFNEDGARRIIAATKVVEGGNRNMPPVRFRDQGGDDGDPVRLGKTSSAWNKGTTATINIWESGTPPSETQTTGVSISGCVNKFANVATGKWVMLAKAGNGSWYLIAAEC